MQQHIRTIGIFSAGLICGLALQWMPASSVTAFGRGDSGNGGIAGGGGGGVAGANCPADIAPSPDGDGVVDVDDLLAVINAWGQCEKDPPPPPECDPNGFWIPDAAAFYSCAFGQFIMNVTAWEFSQFGSTLQVTPFGEDVVMTGPATDCVAGNSFTVSGTNSGGCSVTYTLSGTFDSNTQFTGTFTVAFTGSCSNCTTQVFNITATHK